MAAAITTTATTLEGQLIEVVRELEELEIAIPAAQKTAENQRLSISTDFDNALVSIAIALPVTVGGTGGAITVTAAAYLT